MNLTGRNLTVWNEIEKWEQSYFSDGETNLYYSLEMNLNEAMKILKPESQKKLHQTIDSIIFHTHAIIKNSRYDQQLTSKVLNHGRVFDTNIDEVSEMKRLTIDQLRYITNQNLARQRLISFAQGGIIGSGGFFFVALDLPLMLTINLRSIQLIALTYGYDLNRPFELMLALKVFHAATLPKPMQKQGWINLMNELNSYQDEWLFFDDGNYDKSTVWLQQPLKQIAKGIILLFLKRKLVNGIPLLGITTGATINYFLAKQVAEIAHHFYQKRFLLEEKK